MSCVRLADEQAAMSLPIAPGDDVGHLPIGFGLTLSP
jgi:hypothetical protein